MRSKNLEWNVYIYQNDEIKTYNIFKHEGFCDEIQEIKHFKDLGDERVKIELAYWFRNRSEYEIGINSIFGGNPQKKISVYDQIILNFDKFIEYLRRSL